MNKRTLVFLVCFILCVCAVAYHEVSGLVTGEGLPAASQTEKQTGPSTRDELIVENPDPAASAAQPQEHELLDPEEQIIMGCTFHPVDDDHSANMEMQTYVKEQAVVDGNLLRMEAVPARTGYLSGKVETDNSFRYGEFAFRVTSLTGKGLFPAIWMLPSEGTEYPEVDIYETIGSRPHEVYGVLHFLNENGKKDRDFFTYHYDREQVPESYVIGFTWERDEMVWYLDGMPVYTIRENVPDVPMFMIANLAVGGTWPGSPDKTTQFPAAFQVEVLKFEPQEIYVR